MRDFAVNRCSRGWRRRLANSTCVAVINQTMVRRYFAGHLRLRPIQCVLWLQMRKDEVDKGRGQIPVKLVCRPGYRRSRRLTKGIAATETGLS